MKGSRDDITDAKEILELVTSFIGEHGRKYEASFLEEAMIQCAWVSMYRKMGHYKTSLIVDILTKNMERQARCLEPGDDA